MFPSAYSLLFGRAAPFDAAATAAANALQGQSATGDAETWLGALGILALGLAIGLTVGYWLGRSGGRAQLATLRERLRFFEGERRRAEAAVEEQQQLRQALAEAQAHRRVEAERVEWLRSAEEQLRVSFEHLARDVFADAVRDGGDDVAARSRTQLEQVVEPLRLTLAHLDTQVREIEQTRQGAYQGLRRELQLLRDAQRQLHHSTRDLKQALRTSSGSRGRWGELQLQRLVEMAGLKRHVDYLEQPTVEGGQRPDMIVRLPGGGSLPIDAKAPMRAYLLASEEDEPAERTKRLDEHLRALKARINELGSKAYWQKIDGSPDFVVMFLPHDGVLASAFERDPELLDFCLDRRVLPATPVTLLALLRTVAWSWQRQQVAEGAERIADAGRELHVRLGRMLDHLARTGRGLDAAVQAYNDTVGSFERRLLPSVRRLEELGARDAVDTPPPLTRAVRPPTRDTPET
ncbi:MAG: DNA recombination protein RmuC [Acidobacteriota bacterium]